MMRFNYFNVHIVAIVMMMAMTEKVIAFQSDIFSHALSDPSRILF